MDTILEKLEVLIEDIESDESLTKDEIHTALSRIHAEIEEYQIRREEGNTLNWEDLD